MKKSICMVFIVIFCLSLTLPCAAADGFVDAYYRVVDIAGLLTEDENWELIAKLDEISIRQSMDIVVLTTDTLDGDSPMDYADYAYDSLQFGYGDSRDGVLLLVSIAESDWYISTCGYGITAFTDAGIQHIGDEIRPYLSDGDFMTAFERYAELCDEFITRARSGEPYDRGTLPKEPFSHVKWIFGSLIVGFIVATIVVGRMKGQLKTVRAQNTANSYMKKDSMNVAESRDLFLYRTVTRTAKATNNGGGGGSSTHRSSSGTTHGGGGGKF